MAAYTMFKGETLTILLTVKNPDGTAKDLTGAKLYVTVKNQFSEQDSSAVWQGFTPASGVVVTNAALGLATGTMPPTATYGLPGDQDIDLVYDAKCIDAAGIETVVDSGTITAHPAVTRAIQ